MATPIEESFVVSSKREYEDVELKDRILKSGKILSSIMTPVMANVHFDAFKESLQAGDFEKVYTSAVFNAITDLCTGTATTIVNAGTKVLRARIIKDLGDIYGAKKGIHFEDEIIRGYDWYNSKEPAVGISSEGRANSRYSSYLYCATDGPTAASEIKANIGDYISLASFTTKRDLKLVRFEIKDIFEGETVQACIQNLIARSFSVPVSDTQEYRLTQFISDEIRKHGVDGICYKSHFTHHDNYVIFNCSMDTIKFTNSKIIRLHSQQLNFVDFSADKMISTKAIPDPNVNEIKREKHHIFAMMKSYEDEIMTVNASKDEKR